MTRARLLCVDDNSLVLETTKACLELAGYSVLTSASGDDAISSMREPFDAAVVDYEMPNMNGEELAKRLKEKQHGLPVDLFSGSTEIPASALHEVAAFVLKGSSPSELLDSLASLTATTMWPGGQNETLEPCKEMPAMQIFENAETIDRLVAQGEVLLKALHAVNENDLTGHHAEILKGELAGWCSTLHTLYRDHADSVVERARAKASLPVPLGSSGCCAFVLRQVGCPTQGSCRWNHFPKPTSAL